MSTTAPKLSAGLTERLSHDVDGGFAELVDAYQQSVFTTAFRLSGRRADAEDLAAETFLRAYSALRRYPSERIGQLKPKPWLITILLNLWRNQVRASGRRPAQAYGEASQDVPTSAETPEDRVQRHDREERLARLLAGLPDRQRVAVVLRHVIGLSYAEIGEILRCPEGTAKSHVSRGLARLRTLLSNPNTEENLS